MHREPYFSVILPNYNHGNYLKKAIDSVINQDYKNWELLIIDNHSTDNSHEIISSYNDPRIKSFKINNDGVIAISRNHGIKNSKAEWIAFLDSDDIWYKNKLSTLFHYTSKSYDIICSNEYEHKINTGQKKANYYNLKTDNFYSELLIHGNKLSTSSTVVRRSFMKNKNLLFNENRDFISVEDYDLWLQIALKKGSFAFCREFLGEYRIHSNNLSNNFDLHYNNLKKLLLMHVFEIQEFSDNYKLWELIEPRLKLIEIRYHYSQNILNGIRFSILELLNQKLIKSFRLVKYCIKKVIG